MSELALIKSGKVLVTTDETFQRAKELLKRVVLMRREIEDHYKPMIKKAYDTHKGLTQAMKDQTAEVVDAENILKKEIERYQLKIRQELEEEERAKIAMMDEASRIHPMSTEERQEMVTMQQMAKTLNRSEEIKTEGVSNSYSYELEVTNKKEFLKWLIDNHDKFGGVDLIDSVVFNVGELKKIVKRLKGQLKIGGVNVKETVVTRVII